MLIVCMPRMKFSYIRAECEYRKPMSLLYKHYYMGYCLYTEDYIDSLVKKQRNNATPTGNRPGATQASRRNLHRTRSSHLQLLSSVTARVSGLMVATQQV
jgi:hypothetical protein